MVNHVRTRDLGWRKIKTSVHELSGRGVKVGLRADSGAVNGVLIVDYAAFNEYGTERIPPRPFMRRTADTSEKQVPNYARILTDRIIKGTLDADGALDLLGVWYRERIKTTIRAAKSWATPLAASTIQRKGSTSPLINKSFLINAVNYQKDRM